MIEEITHILASSASLVLQAWTLAAILIIFFLLLIIVAHTMLAELIVYGAMCAIVSSEWCGVHPMTLSVYVLEYGLTVLRALTDFAF